MSYRTAQNSFRECRLNAYQTHTGPVIVREDNPSAERKAAVYRRVSCSEDKANLASQKKTLVYCSAARRWKVSNVITGVDSGRNDIRKRWLFLLQDRLIRLIVVERKERFTRFDFHGYTLLENDGRDSEGVNEAEDGREDLLQDLVSIITGFCAGLYGQTRRKGKTESIMQQPAGLLRPANPSFRGIAGTVQRVFIAPFSLSFYENSYYIPR